MESAKETLEILHDLVKLNNDRIAGYERALKEINDEEHDLKYLFTNLIGESHQFKMELGTEIQALGKDIDTSTTNSGKIHRAWIDLKSAFTGEDTKSILEECEFGEDAIKKAYQTAINEEHVPAFIKDMLTRQRQILLAAHDEIKNLRDKV